ncbi:MAG: SRPBCC domain-containing protein [bacterium]|nr:MAG: SRPBCC domain-containing protein [bacterium]
MRRILYFFIFILLFFTIFDNDKYSYSNSRDSQYLREGKMDKIIHLSVQLSINSTQAFKYFTDNKLLESWLVKVAEVEPQVGGKYELFWEPSDRENNSTIGCKITGLAEGQLISFEWRSPKQFKQFANNADPLTHVVVSFIPQNNKTTIIHIIHSGWRSNRHWEEARLWQEQAWRAAIKRLHEIVNQK